MKNHMKENHGRLKTWWRNIWNNSKTPGGLELAFSLGCRYTGGCLCTIAAGNQLLGNNYLKARFFSQLCHLLVCCLAYFNPKRTLHHRGREVQGRLVLAKGGADFDLDEVVRHVRTRGYEEAGYVLLLPGNLWRSCQSKINALSVAKNLRQKCV